MLVFKSRFSVEMIVIAPNHPAMALGHQMKLFPFHTCLLSSGIAGKPVNVWQQKIIIIKNKQEKCN